MRDGLVVRMVRFGATPILVAALLNVFQFHEKTGLYWSWALGCAWFNAFLGSSTLALSFVEGFTKKWRPVMFVVLLGLIGSDTVLGTIGHEPKLLFISLILLMVGTGSILPWSIRVQISFNLLCLTVWVAQGFWVPSLDGMGAYKMLALITAASLSYFTCYLRDRFVREYEESERTILESESSLRQLFDANTDGITLIDLETRRIQDVNEHFLRISGFRREDVIGKTISELDVWIDPEASAEFNRRLRAGDSITNMEVSFRVSAGRIVPCLLSCVVIGIHGRQCLMTLARDISDLRRSQEKFRQSEATQRRIFNATLDWMSIAENATGDYLDVNESFARATGYSREEILGSNFFKMGLWPDEAQWAPFTETLVTTGEVRNHPATFRMKDGRLVPSLISAVQCELWGKLCCISVARDISDLSAAQERLRRSEETFRTIFDASLDAMSISEAETGRYVDVNPEFLRATGFTREEIIGKTGDDLRQWADPNQRNEFQRLLIEKGEVRNMLAEGRRKDGSIITCLTSGVITVIGGKFRCLGVTRDISELKAAEQNLRKSETMLRAIFDASLDNMALIDLTNQNVIEVNPEMTKTIGYSRVEMIGKRFARLMSTVDSERAGKFLSMLTEGREVRNYEMDIADREGRTRPVLISASILNFEGRPCALSVARDITDLVAAREAALAASRSKSEFLSIMSHEIRTPMNAILGMADLMGESELNSEQRHYLDTVLSNGNALLDLINSILDLAKVESGRLHLETVEFDLIELIEHAADTLAVRAHEKGVELAVRFAPDVAPMLIGDPYRLRQITNNLIGNAIKFTRQGEVVVNVERNPDVSVPGNFRFSVRDTGIGIAPENIDQVFSIFTQADTSTTRKFGGSGLGLAIVRRLVALMGGKVWVESELGKGSTFFFTADLKVGETEALSAPVAIENPQLRELRVLIDIENPSTRGVAGDLLRAKGRVVVEAPSEAAALAAIETAHREHARFNLMVVDCETQAGDGFAALRRIRAAEPHAPVIVLATSHGLAAKLRQMRQEGVKDYCIKPIKRGDLYRAIAEAITSGPSAHASPQAPRDVAGMNANPQKITDRPLRILLADDSPDNRLLIRAYTKKTLYVLTEAENGQLAVERFRDGVFDLVLMDIQMPVLDGYSAIRAIRTCELETGARRTPIIALTASALEEDVRRAKQAGCDLHVSKPIKKSTLLDSIDRAIRSVNASSAPDSSGAIPLSPADFHI